LPDPYSLTLEEITASFVSVVEILERGVNYFHVFCENSSAFKRRFYREVDLVTGNFHKIIGTYEVNDNDLGNELDPLLATELLPGGGDIRVPDSAKPRRSSTRNLLGRGKTFLRYRNARLAGVHCTPANLLLIIRKNISKRIMYYRHSITLVPVDRGRMMAKTP
jgi:hypothetical protein